MVCHPQRIISDPAILEQTFGVLALPGGTPAAFPATTDRLQVNAPALLCPMHEGDLTLDACVPALIRDLSPQGVGFVTRHPLEFSDFAVAFHRHNTVTSATQQLPHVVYGHVRHNTSIGAGFWLVGIVLIEPRIPINSKRLHCLQMIADPLLRPLKA